MSKVIIHVSGGIAEVASSETENVHILDFDNYRDGNTEVEMGSSRNEYHCPKCNKNNSEFEWNAATLFVHEEDEKHYTPFQEVNDDEHFPFVCAYCFEESAVSDIRKKKTL